MTKITRFYSPGLVIEASVAELGCYDEDIERRHLSVASYDEKYMYVTGGLSMGNEAFEKL